MQPRIIDQLSTLPKSKMTPQNLPSFIECAAFSADVYYDPSDPHKPNLPEGWKRFKDSYNSTDDYRGACYVKEFNGIPTVIIANRGTVPGFDTIGTLIAASQIMREMALQQFLSAQHFLMECFGKLGKKYGDEKLSQSTLFFTGHSLGGVLSDFLTNFLLNSVMSEEGRLKSITFENPGSKPNIIAYLKEHGFNELIPKIILQLSNICEAYQADVNLINTCNEQIGNVFRLNLPYDYYASPGPISPNDISELFYKNDYYLLGYLLDQHSITNSLAYLKKGGNITGVDNHPHGVFNGYIAYLDQDTRKEYWLNYFKTCWEVDPMLRIRYLNNFDDFYESAKKNLREIQEIAIASLPSVTAKESQVLNKPVNDLNPKVISTSQLGFFNEKNIEELKKEDDIESDFVFINKDDSDEYIDPKKRCSIM